MPFMAAMRQLHNSISVSLCVTCCSNSSSLSKTTGKGRRKNKGHVLVRDVIKHVFSAGKMERLSTGRTCWSTT